MKVHAVETTFDPQFTHRAQKLAIANHTSIGDAALELIVTAQAPPETPPVDPVAALEAATPHIDVIA